jgi:ABC-2 type transport system permease protein
MSSLSSMIWIEYKKAIRSKIPYWTALGAIFMPLGIAFLIFVARNPEIAENIGLISAKANLLAYSSTDWTTYLGLFGQLIAAGGFFFFILVISWVFGREFTDGTVKDILAVPVQRWSILLAKYIVASVWSIFLTMLIFIVAIIMGFVTRLPGGSLMVILQDSSLVLVTSVLVITSVLPFALFASVGRGYLLPVGLAVLTLMVSNLVAIIGYGEYFPWAIPGLYAQGKSSLSGISYLIVIITGLAGMSATYLWWKYADQSR